jgi:hypothetical protein
MKIEQISCVEDAISLGQSLPYVYLREYSRVWIGRTPEVLHKDQLIEARFFSRDTELRIVRKNGELCAVQLTAEPEDRFLEKTLPLMNPKLFGDQIKVRNYFASDADGQAYIAHTCLAHWEGGEAYGTECKSSL